MKKIAVISMGVKLDNEKGYRRFRYIGEFLSDAGYQVGKHASGGVKQRKVMD